ncbi:unnamed protein product [Phaedon cochleariae]|uniref:PH domain-containing protein n=1 Tax=Phaedon cochleariae TaxID=80249 RepID=A0A9P0GK17_PHACE|nr:unnamed protein product [Phaedon cochleariae]
MESNYWILLIKNVIRKYCKTDSNHNTIKMSEIETSSISSDYPESKVNTENNDSQILICNIVNDLKSNDDNEDFVTEKLNNSISKINNTDGQALRTMDENDNETRLPKLIIKPNVDQTCFVNDFTKAKTPVDDKNSSTFVITNHHEKSSNRPMSTYKQKQPIMGKTALLKKANIDPDSQIIQGIILNKYEDVLNHYVHRMYKRRISRLSSSEDEFSDTLSSPQMNYSPSSVSSIGTPGSFANATNRFEFPDRESLCQAVPNRFRFLMSTDDINVETTAEELNESSLISSDLGNTVSMTSVSEYDPKKFLENALGELTSLSESGICNDSSPSANNQQCEQSIGSSNLSALLSKAGSFCSSVKKNIRRRRSSLKTVCLLENMNSHSPEIKQLLETCKKELSMQNAIMFQISKALNYCRSSKEFDSGKEHIEAEKILLVATITKEVLINEINSIEFNTYQNNFDPRCSGEINLQNLRFHLKKNNSMESHQNTREYFLVVVTCGKAVISSEVVEEIGGTVLIEKSFQFRNLLADFEIALSIYSMTVRGRVHSNQDNVKCPSPKSIFKCSKDSKKIKIASTLYIEPLAFTLLGKCLMRISDLSKINPNNESTMKLCNVSPHASLSENFTLKMDYKFSLATRVGGFLTVGTENGNVCTTWNRRWCVLESYILKYWNYPSEEVSSPLGSIDLRCCLVQSISPANRSICARSKTLFMPVQHGTDVKKYLLCADSAADMNIWEKELNFVLQSLMIWNGMECRT